MEKRDTEKNETEIFMKKYLNIMNTEEVYDYFNGFIRGNINTHTHAQPLTQKHCPRMFNGDFRRFCGNNKLFQTIAQQVELVSLN